METSNMPSLRERLWGKTLPLREKLEKAKDLAVATAKEIPGEMAKQVGQPMLRGFAATGAKIAAMDKDAQFVPHGQFQKDLLGTDKPIDFGSVASETFGGYEAKSTMGKMGMSVLGGALSVADAVPGGGQAKKGISGAAKAFDGFTDLTTKTLDKLVGRGKVSKQFISDLLNAPDVRQTEKDVMRAALDDADDVVDVASYADKVKTNLLPLKRVDAGTGYEGTTLKDGKRGGIANYSEHVYSSPIKTKAGDVHYSNFEDYFAHTRVEDLPSPNTTERYLGDIAAGKKDYVRGKFGDENAGTTRRVIEIQSDLMQKGRLENEGDVYTNPMRFIQPQDAAREREIQKVFDNLGWDVLERHRNPNIIPASVTKGLGGAEKAMDLVAEANAIDSRAVTAMKEYNANRQTDLSKLAPYRNTWHERIIREEVKQAAIDGKTKLQFPVGKTAMQIEGLGTRNNWDDLDTELDLKSDALKVGKEIVERDRYDDEAARWIVTDVLGDGKFKAIKKSAFVKPLADETFVPADIERLNKQYDSVIHLEDGSFASKNLAEQFDISGKVDEANPIYKFYEKEVGKFLQKNYGAKRIIDPQGVEWWEMDVKQDWKDKAVFAHGMSNLGATAAVAGATAMGVAMSTPSRTVYDMKQEERPPQIIETTEEKETEPEPAPAIRTLEEKFIGTNYDPYDPDQTRPNPDGRGAAGVLMDDNMVATALKEDGITGNLRLGTVIRIPELGNRLFLVADIMSQDFNGMNKIDFVRAEKKKTSDPEVNKKFSNIEIVREGNGRADARELVESGEWAKMLNQQTPQ